MTADAELVKRLLERYGARQNLRNPDGPEVADAIERLTRERDEAISSRALAIAAKEHAYRERQHLIARAEAAEANLIKARAALIGIADYWESDPEPSPGTLFDAIEEMQRRARAALKGE